MDHSLFIKSLSEIGITVKVTHEEQSSYYLTINGNRIPTDKYEVFGYRCSGTYATCHRTEKNDFSYDDLKAATLKAVQILDGVIEDRAKDVDYYSILDYFRYYTDNCKKADKAAIDRVKKILKENFQTIYYKRYK